MTAIELTEIKNCMAHLLLKDTFDHFLLVEGEITTFASFKIDGFLKKNFFDTQDQEFLKEEYTPWKQLRELCFSIIKGKRTPLSFTFVFSLPHSKIASLIEQEGLSLSPDNVQGVYLNFRYDGKSLQCITGTSLKTFSMDRSLEQVWDKAAEKWISQLF